jgi:excisionase family DNA binding protein
MWNDCPPGEKLLTKCEVAQLCRVEIRTVNRWLAAGKISCFRTPGGRLLFRKRDVLMAAERGASPVTPGTAGIPVMKLSAGPTTEASPP